MATLCEVGLIYHISFKAAQHYPLQ